ncbi:MMPL family transporter, partial [Cellulomonas endophytica]|uniref:MMPL family transporter n=1 Tax=Cellulomonas endophytica TaxID=2494735 RepID=UPI0013E966A3
MLSISRAAGRRLLVLVAVVVWLAIAGIGGPTQGRLSEVQTNDQAAFLPSSAESAEGGEAAAAFVEQQTLPALVVLRPEGRGTVPAEALAAVQGWAAGIPDLPLPPAEEGAASDAPADGTWSSYLVGEPVVAPSEDGEALLVVLAIDGARADERLGEDSVAAAFVTALRADLEASLGTTATTAGPDGLLAWVTGPAGFVADLVTAFGGIDGVLLLVALGAVLLILVVVYRSPVLPLVVILTAVFALALAGLVVYLLADADLLVLNGQSQGILSILVVGAAVDYSLLLVARYREELRLVEDPATAMRRAVRASVEPIAASAGTVVAGLLCLLLSDLGSNRALGPVGTVGIVSALLAALTLLPALLLLPGRRARALFWPRAPRPVAAGAGP